MIRQGFAMTWDMPIRPIESGPLTSREIKELDAFLHAEDGLENPMDFYTFDGFICAVLSAPNTIMPSEWLRWVWDQEQGERLPEFSSEKQAKRILSLLIGHANVLAHADPRVGRKNSIALVLRCNLRVRPIHLRVSEASLDDRDPGIVGHEQLRPSQPPLLQLDGALHGVDGERRKNWRSECGRFWHDSDPKHSRPNVCSKSLSI